MIQKNAPSVVDVPKIKEKNIIRMDANEVAQLIDNIESGEKLSKTQKIWHNKNKLRDLAIVVTLLGTGVRVTELVGLDISDLDLTWRHTGNPKGGNEDIVYFGEETEEMLRNYLDERLTMEPESGHENALFISQKNTRITVRSVERLVKKYASTATAKKLRLTNSEAPTERPCTRRPVISIWLQTYWDTKMSIQPENIMLQ